MNEDKNELIRGLTLTDTTALVVGTMIGSGVFLKTAVMTQEVGTPTLVLLAWVAAGLLSLAGALTYAELGAMLPNAGGEYLYLRKSYGEAAAFLFGWQRFIVAGSASIASLGSGFAIFLAAFLPLNAVWAEREVSLLGRTLPVASKAAGTFLGEYGGKLVAVAFVISAFGALNGSILSNARAPYAMARDGLFFSGVGHLSALSRVPVRAVIIQAIWSSVLAVSRTFDQLTDCLLFASWIFYGLVTSSVFVLRRKMPDAPRPYKTVGYPLVPLVFVLVSSWLVVNTFIEKRVESVTGIILILMGLPLYAWFRRKQGAWASP